jgi:hypothetical protein
MNNNSFNNNQKNNIFNNQFFNYQYYLSINNYFYLLNNIINNNKNEKIQIPNDKENKLITDSLSNGANRIKTINKLYPKSDNNKNKKIKKPFIEREEIGFVYNAKILIFLLE